MSSLIYIYFLSIFSFCTLASFLLKGFTLNVGDYLSLFLVFLILFILVSCWFCSENKYITLYLILSLGRILLFFIRSSLFWLFVFFEIRLYPIFVIIVGWGYQFERLQRAKYIFFYTVFCSIPLFFSAVFLIKHIFTFFLSPILRGLRNFLLFCIILSFFVKLPLFTLHLWLPKAHVEAPTIGRIILAGVLLKLGIYGLVRLLFLFKTMLIRGWWRIILLGRVYSATSCFLQRDGKRLVAYSSVAHINFLIGLFLLYSIKGVVFSIYVLFSHGVISCLIFFFIGFIYQKTSSRVIYLISSILLIRLILFIFLILIIIRNFGVPPFIRRVREIFIFSLFLKIRGSYWLLLLAYGIVIRYACIFFIISFYQGRRNLVKKLFFSLKEQIIIALRILIRGNLLFYWFL